MPGCAAAQPRATPELLQSVPTVVGQGLLQLPGGPSAQHSPARLGQPGEPRGEGAELARQDVATALELVASLMLRTALQMGPRGEESLP